MSNKNNSGNYLGVDTAPYNDPKKYPLIERRIITNMNDHLISCNPKMSYIPPKTTEKEKSDNLNEVMVIVEKLFNGKLEKTLRKLEK